MRSSLPRQVGSCACQVGVGFAVVGWFRRFRPPPPVVFRVRRPLLFFSLALSGFARSGPGVLVWVFAPSLFFCVPFLGPRLSNLSSHFHFHFMFIPLFIFIFTSLHANHPASGRVCVCVRANRLNRRKTSPPRRACWALVVHRI